MFENRSQQSNTEVKIRIERSQNSSHEQTCFLLNKNIAGRKPETTRIVVQNNLYPNLDKIRISKKNTRNNKNSRPI